jgi:hypothetical protein
MGDYLSTPITEKHFEDNENEKVGKMDRNELRFEM